MTAANAKKMEELEKEHDKHLMDEEDQVTGIWQAKLDYLCSIGDKKAATALAESKLEDATVPKSHRIEAVFTLFRISYFHNCNIKGMKVAIEKASELIEGISGGDWSARNKLKAYEGMYTHILASQVFSVIEEVHLILILCTMSKLRRLERK